MVLYRIMALFTKDRRKRKIKFYNSPAWRKLSSYHRKQSPLCVRCLDRGIHTLAKVADHDNPIWEGREGLTRKLNSLCLDCHSEKTKVEDIPKLIVAEKTKFRFF